MLTDRIHRATSADGTEIAGRVHGHGPPLVLLHGGLEDGDLLWEAMLPFLSERFTCYLMSTRCRGLSGQHSDLSLQRLGDDVVAFVESIGEPAGLIGESSGGMHALGAASRSDAVSAVCVYEPVVFEAMGEEEAAGFQDTVAVISAMAADGRMAEAVRSFAEPLLNDDELASMPSTYYEESARYIPVLLEEIRQSGESSEPGPTDPSVLARITAPVLVLLGARTAMHSWFAAGARHVAEHVANVQVKEIDGVGHWGPVLRPEPIADELIRFFETRV